MNQPWSCRRALAQLRGPGGISGRAVFTQQREGVMVEITARGLPKTETGFFALHIHSGSSCQGAGFPETQGHFDPLGRPHPCHAGDLPPLLADFGRGYLKTLTSRFSLPEILGKTLVLHSGPDDFHSQPAGNPGEKIACGVIQPER